MRRILATAAAAGLAFASLGVLSTSQAQAEDPQPLASSDVRIQEMAVFGPGTTADPTGAENSYIELLNIDPVNAVDISGWRFVRCNADGSTTSTVFTVPAATPPLAEFDVTAPRDSIYLLAAGGYVDSGGVTVADATVTALGLGDDAMDTQLGIELQRPQTATSPAQHVDGVSIDVDTGGCIEPVQGAGAPRQTVDTESAQRTLLAPDTDNNSLNFSQQTRTPGTI